uniref:Uncharacterized protein n=1 Tax=Euplotes crassus TaxID=5936 RepID=A0A7S3KGE3_EUPCR
MRAVNSQKKLKVKKYYNKIMPEGMSIQEYKISMARKRKEEKEQNMRKRMIFMANKWDYIKEENLKAKAIQDKIKSERNYVKIWTGFKALHYGIKNLSHIFGIKKVEEIKRARSLLIANKINYLFKKKQMRKGSNLSTRLMDIARHSLVLTNQVLEQNCHLKAKRILVHFMKDLKWKRTLSVNCIDCWAQILKVRHRFLHIIKMTRERMSFLTEKWEEQKSLLINEYEKDIIQHKSKTARKMRK